jgi:hypothetical protein
MHPIDFWLAHQNLDAWHYASPGHLVGPDAKPEDDFDRLVGFDDWLRKVRADLKGRCRLPQSNRPRPRHGFG